jgi:20S proteasome alpha/beta subunit
MTLCIGARANVPSPLSKSLVFCFDFKVANDAWGSESEYKFHILSDQLLAMVAGSPAKAKELALMYEAHLKEVILSEATALEALRKPLADLKFRKADWYVRMRLGVSYLEFLNHGAAWFGSAITERYLASIESHQPNVEMIIGGFIDGAPVLYRIARDEEGVLDLNTETNFCLIGSGAATAEPALHARSQTNTTALSETLYNVYEAKKIGESSPYVGQKTRIYILHPPNGTSKRAPVDMVTKEGEEWLAGLYAKYGPKKLKTWPNIPANAIRKTGF